MFELKQLILTSCDECPFCELYDDLYCDKYKKLIQSGSGRPHIPDWCQLDDYKGTTLNKEKEDWKKIALKFGGILLTAKKENTDEWMEYIKDTLNDAEQEISEIDRNSLPSERLIYYGGEIRRHIPDK